MTTIICNTRSNNLSGMCFSLYTKLVAGEYLYYFQYIAPLREAELSNMNSIYNVIYQIHTYLIFYIHT